MPTWLSSSTNHNPSRRPSPDAYVLSCIGPFIDLVTIAVQVLNVLGRTRNIGIISTMIGKINDYWKPFASIAREEESLARRDRRTIRNALLLHLPDGNGRTVPAIDTLEKFARALEVPLYQLFYDGGKPPKKLNLTMHKSADNFAWGSSGRDARWLARFRSALARAENSDQKLLMFVYD